MGLVKVWYSFIKIYRDAPVIFGHLMYSLCVLLPPFYNVSSDSSDARSCLKNARHLCSQTKTQIRHNLLFSSHMIGVRLVDLSSVFKLSRDEQRSDLRLG